MRITQAQQDKIRNILRDAFDAIGILFWFVKRVAKWSFALWLAFILFALLTADPDTATFRDFLLAVQNKGLATFAITAGIIAGPISWMLGLRRPSTMPRNGVAMAAVGRSALDRAATQAKEKDHE